MPSDQYQRFKREVENILSIHPTETQDIYTAIKRRYPEDCDDTIPCAHGRGTEWEHTVRNTQQTLKREGKIKLNRATKKWELVRNR
ncbi:MAG: hypothetical protein PHX21_06765 [bacterium]|nr:hypothetical protein [bacterium]